MAWYDKNSGPTTQPIGLKQANAFGLYDMLGNVFEWTADNFDKTKKLMRGGSWDADAKYVRASFRFEYEPTFFDDDLGFRCVRELR